MGTHLHFLACSQLQQPITPHLTPCQPITAQYCGGMTQCQPIRGEHCHRLVCVDIGSWFNILAPGPRTRHCTAAANTEYRNSDMWSQLFGLSFNDTLNWSAPSFMEASRESEILRLLAWALSFSKKMQDCACKCNKISAQKVLQQLCYNLSAT